MWVGVKIGSRQNPAQLQPCWAAHIDHIPDHWLLKGLFYGELKGNAPEVARRIALKTSLNKDLQHLH